MFNRLLFIVLMLSLVCGFSQAVFAYDDVNETYYPSLTPPSKIYVVVMWADSDGDPNNNPTGFPPGLDEYYSDSAMLNSLSGVLIKQHNSEGVYTENRQAARDILMDIAADANITYEYVGSGNPMVTGWDIIDHFKSDFNNRYILYDVNSPDSMNAARMASYTYNCPIIDVCRQNQATSHGLSVALDVRTYTDQWIYNNWWPTWPIKDLAVENSNLKSASARVFLNDVAAAMGAVCFYDGTSTTLRQNFLSGLDDDSPVLGWPDFDEITAVTEMSQRNTQLLGANYCANISMLTAFKDQSQWPIYQDAHHTRAVETGKHYVCFVMTDGDNLQWYELDFPTGTEWWGSPYRGTFSMGWGIPLSLRDLGQNVVEFLYGTASITTGAQDNFVAMGTGGYAYPSLFSSAARTDNATRTAKYMADMDTSILCILDKAGFDDPSIYEPYLQESAIDAIFYWDVDGDYAKYAGDIKWVSGKPIISAYEVLWGGVTTPAGLATLINARSTNSSTEGAYSLIPVHAWSMGVDDIRTCVQLLDSDVVVVTPEEFVKLINANLITPGGGPLYNIDLGNWQRGTYGTPGDPSMTVTINSTQQQVDGTPSTKVSFGTVFTFSNMNFSAIDTRSADTLEYDLYSDGSGATIRLEFYSSAYSAFIYKDHTLSGTGWTHYSWKLDGTDGLSVYGSTYANVESSINIFQVTSSWNSTAGTYYIDNMTFAQDGNDRIAPTPDPMTFATLPYATGNTSIRMVATTATDSSGVEYYFDETSGTAGGTDSGWQSSAIYEDTGLTLGTTYTYRVKARDLSVNQNDTAVSFAYSASTTGGGDTTPPTPNPMTWATVPYATGTTSISMTATTASDSSGVEYYFTCTAGGGHSSSWQSSPTYADTGLSPGTQYTYTAKARDLSTNHNETTASSPASATTNSAVPTFVAAGAVSSGTGAITPALPSGIATNDILLLFLETSNQAISISNSNGGTWTGVTNSPQYCGTAAGSTGARLTAFWSRYNGTQGAPTTSDSGDHQLGRIIAIRGAVASGNPWNVTAGGVEAVSDTSGSIPGATTTVANTLVVTAIATSLPDASSTAKFSGWTNANLTSLTERTDNSVTAGNGGGLGIATGVKTTAGAYGNTAVTLVNAAYKGMISIAIKN